MGKFQISRQIVDKIFLVKSIKTKIASLDLGVLIKASSCHENLPNFRSVLLVAFFLGEIFHVGSHPDKNFRVLKKNCLSKMISNLK